MKILIQMIGYLRVVLFVAHKLRSPIINTIHLSMTTQSLRKIPEEVKSYKTNIREYVSKYDKVDTFEGDTTDFDVHAFYDEDLQLFQA